MHNNKTTNVTTRDMAKVCKTHKLFKKAGLYGQLKLADDTSSFLGRYFNMSSLPNQQMLSKTPTASGVAAGMGGVGNLAVPGSGMITGPLSEMVLKRNALGGSIEDRRQSLDTADKEIQNTSMGDNAWNLAKNMALPMGLMGGGLGALYGAGSGHSQPGSDSDKLMAALKGALTSGLGGAAIGAAGGALGGAGAGVINKLINENTSQGSKDRAKDMVAKHPYLTSIPGGNLFGAAFG